MVTLLDVKMRVPAGTSIVWNGYPHSDEDRMAVVMMPGPVVSSVWAVEFGNWLCLKWHGKRQMWVNVTRDHKDVADQRAAVVAGMVAAYRRLHCYGLMYEPPRGERWTREAADAHDRTVTAQLATRFWAELYGVTQTD